MSEGSGARSCPGCGAVVDSMYCPHCGSATVPAPEPPWSDAHQLDAQADDTPTVPGLPVQPRTEGPASAVPGMFPTEMVPAAPSGASQAWSQAPDGPAGQEQSAGLFPEWTGVHPAVGTAAPAGGGGFGPRPERRRALYAVLAIGAVTVLVLAAALLLGPRLGGRSDNIADKDGQPTAAATRSNSPAQSSAATGRTGTAGSAAVPATPTAVRTVTVTAAPTRAGTSTGGASTGGTSSGGTLTGGTPTNGSLTTKQSTTKSAPAAPNLPLGVPQRDIACNPGYIVQLASEFDAKKFAARVAGLKSAGQVPAGSLAADAAHSCKIFTSQKNTVVLYAGPFSSRYAGCSARLAGPADAFIKGSNTDNAREYVSCLCPAKTASLPQFSAVGQQGVWAGELQRALGNRLNIDIADLSGNWGVFTAGTKAAVQRFQQSVGLPADGVMNARTWQAVQSAEC